MEERERLEAIQRAVDGRTVEVVEGLSPRRSWDCLELGAGAGSIAYWLAGRCPDGRTVAVDLDTGFLDPGRAANLEVVRADVTAPDFTPGRFDLVHARFLLCHLSGRDDVLARAVDWLRPGGWLVVEDPYLLPAETSSFPVVRRIMHAYLEDCAARGSDMTWARGLPTSMLRAGLVDVDYSGLLGRMGGAEDRWAPLLRRAAPALLANGSVTEADLAGFDALLADPAFLDVPQFTMSAWGRRG
ncbi:SAM-dependent methyltransferase [Saccharothrix ecbatanensis]|uniref:SAM-dependent methyltransferase n=1 Tax=Saccharothrix ecbatanensis TaxID=1105145 RepID=A0A7W9HDY9_9PSEU|nr:class I SAM-dependent methyltransferase [Saccharothrix ecbatanensis]MBB5800497.1 SAM-dependent methyltransferase [Saccharothrix ecbatanensis]